MKILFCTYSYPDYGLDTIFAGLCEVLGSENVFDYPTKPTLHGAQANSFANYPLHHNFPSPTSDELKLEMLRQGTFDVILIGCRTDSAFWNGRREHLPAENPKISDPIQSASVKIPTFLIDQSDYCSTDYVAELIKRFHALKYFKREYLRNQKYPDYIAPLSFSYTPNTDVLSVDTPRSNDIFWAGRGYRNRSPYLEILTEVTKNNFSDKCSQSEYIQKMLSSKIGLSLKGYGNDTVRYYEIPAHGTMLFSEKLDIMIENDFVDGKTAVFFDSPEEMKEKLEYFINNPSKIERIRIAGHKWFTKFHASRSRAEQLIAKIKSTI